MHIYICSLVPHGPRSPDPSSSLAPAPLNPSVKWPPSESLTLYGFLSQRGLRALKCCTEDADKTRHTHLQQARYSLILLTRRTPVILWITFRTFVRYFCWDFLNATSSRIVRYLQHCHGCATGGVAVAAAQSPASGGPFPGCESARPPWQPKVPLSSLFAFAFIELNPKM